MSDDKNTQHRSDVDFQRPMRDLLLLMPHMQARQVEHEFVIDWASAEAQLLRQISSNAEVSMKTIQRGTAVIGQLLANSSPEIGLGEYSSDAIADLGWLIQEINDFSAIAYAFIVACNRYGEDYAPLEPPKRIPLARP